MEISSADYFDEAGISLTQRQVADSIRSELQLERRWREYLNPGESGWLRSVEFAARYVYRRIRLAPFGSGGSAATHRGGRMLRRLINIELSHLKLLNNASQNGSSWALILEDDALAVDVPAFAADLHHFLQSQSSTKNPAFLNLSESFDFATLGLSSHLNPHGTWGSHAEILSADRPMTNTVCAILYRDDFLKKLVSALSRIPITPVLPIDWKINAALLDLYSCGEIGPDECWFITPGPILQGSMHGYQAGTVGRPKGLRNR